MKRFVALLFVLVLFSCSEEHMHHDKATDAEFRKSGVEVEAIIEKKYAKKFKTLDGMKREYYISYSFKSKDGKTIKSKFKVPHDIYKVTRSGEPIMAEYIKDNPYQSRLTLDEF